MNISKTSQNVLRCCIECKPSDTFKYLKIFSSYYIIIKNYAEPPVFEVQVAMDAPPDFLSFWHNMKILYKVLIGLSLLNITVIFKLENT